VGLTGLVEPNALMVPSSTLEPILRWCRNCNELEGDLIAAMLVNLHAKKENGTSTHMHAMCADSPSM
jgi:hypothetical protein